MMEIAAIFLLLLQNLNTSNSKSFHIIEGNSPRNKYE